MREASPGSVAINDGPTHIRTGTHQQDHDLRLQY